MADTKNNKFKQNEFIGWGTVSSKGQLSIPASIRRNLNIKIGERLLIILRRNKDGLNLIKENVVNKVFKKFSD